MCQTNGSFTTTDCRTHLVVFVWPPVYSQPIEQGLCASGSGELEFEEFCILAARFLIEEDEEQMRRELKEAFRFYDKEGKTSGQVTVYLCGRIDSNSGAAEKKSILYSLGIRRGIRFFL